MRHLVLFIIGSLICLSACRPDAQRAVQAKTGSVVGGRPARADEIYSTVSVLRKTPETPHHADSFCTGTLVAPSLILTAAHCVYRQSAERFIVGAGYRDRDDFTLAEFVEVERIVVHEGYDHLLLFRADDPRGLATVNDVALLVLRTPITVTDPASIVPMASVGELMPPGSHSVVSGYGQTDDGSSGTLFVAEVTVELTTATEILTTAAVHQGDTCNGDSGGPLYVDGSPGLLLAGVTSRARKDVDANCGEGGIYTLASAYVDWIALVASDVGPVDGGSAIEDAGSIDVGSGSEDGGDVSDTDHSENGLRPSDDEAPVGLHRDDVGGTPIEAAPRSARGCSISYPG